MKNVRKYAGSALIYGFVFITALWFFVVRGVDGEALKMRIRSAAAQRTNMKLDIGSTWVSFPASLKMRDVDMKDEAQNHLHFEKFKAKLKLLPLLLVRPTLQLEARDEKGGVLTLELSRSGFSNEGAKIKLYGKKFPLEKTLISINGWDIPFRAELNAEGVLELPENSIKGAAGNVKFNLDGISIKEDVLTKGFMKKISVESASCELTLEKGVLKTKNCSAKTSEGKLEIKIASKLTAPASNTPLRGSLIITPSGNLLKKLLALYPQYRKPNGRYHLTLKGTFARPRIKL